MVNPSHPSLWLEMHFCKFMVGDFTHKMTIPKKFVNRYGGQISDVVDLKPLSGNIWRVGVAMSRGDMVLLSGWKEFVDAHRVEENDLLLFKFSGNSSFEVLIFDAGGYEKASSFFAKKKDPQMRGSNEGSVEIISVETLHEVINIDSLNNSSDDIVKPEIPHESSGAFRGVEQAGLNRGMASTGTNLQTIHPPKRQRGRPTSEKDIGSSKGIKYDDKNELSESDALEHDVHLDLPYRSPPLAKWQEKKISKLALAARPNPTFLAIMHWSNITAKSCFVNIPRNFAATHLPPAGHEIALEIPNGTKKWLVSYVLGSDRRGICGGWKGFVMDNNLRKGDICLFELMKNRRVLTMTVHII